MHSAKGALVEFGLLFLPGIPAYVWLWPNVARDDRTWIQVLVYLYFLVGSVIIGFRRWTPGQLGLNRRGLGVSLGCGTAIILMMMAGRFAIGLVWAPIPITLDRIVFDIGFYIGLVGGVEEFLFRGLLYRILFELRGDRLAIWGSALAFGIYHIGRQGILGGLGTGLIGVIDGAIRWRAGGIAGLIATHGIYDIIAIEGWPHLTMNQVLEIQVVHPELALIADGLLFGTLIYLWKVHPLVEHRGRRGLNRIGE
ncbi:MAG TPA: CPBP family intramembrane glutamic endopeptidase [Anaerolineae bacterium]